MVDIAPVLQVRSLRKHFGGGEVLRGINLAVATREMVFVIGPSGSGKSTLLRCCNRIEEPTDGTVIVDGAEITKPGVDLNRIRQKIGVVFQSFNLYPHLSAMGNVTLALRKVQKLTRAQAQDRGLDALSRVGLAHKANAYPGELSGGQQQRIAIARALALQPRILLFDEPTSSLDPELVNSVLAVMRDLREAGMTMVVVSHELQFARAAADRIVFMESGAIIFEGTPDEVFGTGGHPRVREFVAGLSGRS